MFALLSCASNSSCLQRSRRRQKVTRGRRPRHPVRLVHELRWVSGKNNKKATVSRGLAFYDNKEEFERGSTIRGGHDMRLRSGLARTTRAMAALCIAVLLAVSLRAAAGQVTIMRYARQSPLPVNHGLPDIQRGFTFCRLRYERTRRQRTSVWCDDYPASDFNFLTRFEELTTVSISRWANGDPGFAQVTLEDPNLFHCPYLKMQGGANYDFTDEEVATLRRYFLKGGFLWEDDNWTEADWEYIRAN